MTTCVNLYAFAVLIGKCIQIALRERVKLARRVNQIGRRGEYKYNIHYGTHTYFCVRNFSAQSPQVLFVMHLIPRDLSILLVVCNVSMAAIAYHVNPPILQLLVIGGAGFVRRAATYA